MAADHHGYAAIQGAPMRPDAAGVGEYSNAGPRRPGQCPLELRVVLGMRRQAARVRALHHEDHQAMSAPALPLGQLPYVARASGRGGVREEGKPSLDERRRLHLGEKLAAVVLEEEVEAAAPASRFPAQHAGPFETRNRAALQGRREDPVGEHGHQRYPGSRMADEGDRVAGPTPRVGGTDEQKPRAGP